MQSTLKSHYRGWEITVRCLRFHARANTAGSSGSFTASGRAVLHDRGSDSEWTDARPQFVTLRGRIYDTTATCAEVLRVEMTVLIDALRKIPASTCALNGL